MVSGARWAGSRGVRSPVQRVGSGPSALGLGSRTSLASLARSCPVLVLSLLLRAQVGHFLLALQFTFTLSCSLTFRNLSHTPSDRLVSFSHLRHTESVEATCSLPLSFEYTQSFILTPSPPSEPGELTRAVILSWLHSAPSSLDISELNPTRHCVPLDLTCKLTAPLFSHPSRLFLFLSSRLMKCLVPFLHHLSNSSC